jgi:type II secretory pathway component PulJ
MNIRLIINLKFRIKNSRVSSSRRGQSLLEVIVGLSIGAILIGAGAFAVSSMLQANFTLQKSQSASALNQELMDQVRAFAGADWQNLAALSKSSTTPRFLVATGSILVVSNGTEDLTSNNNAFTRFFTVEDACREVGAQGALTGTVPCAGGSVTDPSAQYVAVYTRWQSAGNTGEVKSSEYLTRWNNVVFHQSDWSGGAGETGVLVEPGNRFATSTNVDVTSTGTLRVRVF